MNESAMMKFNRNEELSDAEVLVLYVDLMRLHEEFRVMGVETNMVCYWIDRHIQSLRDIIRARDLSMKNLGVSLLEVLHSPDIFSGISWFRPISWRGSGWAFTIRDTLVVKVPTPREGDCGIAPRVSELLEGWELVDPVVVFNAEREKRHE
jgi:hypothetical protein